MSAATPWRLVTFDIDGTLTREHGWRALARAFDRLPEYERSNRRFFAREIGEDEHLADLLELVEGRLRGEVERALDSTPKLARIAEGVAELHRRGIRAGLLTHNPGYVIDFYRRTFGFDEGEGVTVPVDRSDRIQRAVRVHADKPGGLALLLARTGIEARGVVHVGDGWADARVFRLVGGGIALNSPYDEVNRAADRVVRATDFGEVVRAVLAMPPRS